MARQGRLRIGTSGWLYRHWRGAFYPAGLPQSEWLQRYCGSFDSVEINASFYRTPTPQAVARWRAQAPRGFAFAVKGSRFISHNKKLKDPARPLARFSHAMAGLGPRMAVVLWQLPPVWGFDPGRLDAFLRAFRTREGKRRVCFEFRNAQWFAPASLAILRRWNAAFCIYDLAGSMSPLEITADFTYVRLHGTGKYTGEYGVRRLRPWAERIRAWLGAGLDCYVYFNNDHAAAAPRDAARLGRLLGDGPAAAGAMA